MMWIAVVESSGYFFSGKHSVIICREPEGKVFHEPYDDVPEGQKFELTLNVEGKIQPVTFKEIEALPGWVAKYMVDKKHDFDQLEKEQERNHQSMFPPKIVGMIGRRVLYFNGSSGNHEGVIQDKVEVPLASGRDRDYVPMSNYTILKDDGVIDIVNPIHLNRVL